MGSVKGYIREGMETEVCDGQGNIDKERGQAHVNAWHLGFVKGNKNEQV